jgi:hypothetical protein
MMAAVFGYPKPQEWGWRTHKVYNDLWKVPAKAKLAFEVRSAVPNTFVVGLDKQTAIVRLSGNDRWESILLSPDDFRDADDRSDAGAPRDSGWSSVGELSILAKDIKQDEQGQWSKPTPELCNLRWIAGETSQSD